MTESNKSSGSGGGVEAIHRLSPTQEGILLHAIRSPDSGVYFQQFSCLLHGALDPARFAEAWSAVVQRHPALRSLFTWEKRDHPLQVVKRSVTLPFAHAVDAQLVAGGATLERWLDQDRARGFKLDAAPLLRVHVASDAADGALRHRLIWSFHHISLDGWSMRVVLDEVLQHAAGMAATAAAPTFEQYISWLRRQDTAPAESYWRRLLAGFDTPTTLQIETPGNAGATDRARSETRRQLSCEQTQQLSAFARSHRLTPNTVLRGAWALLLARWSGTDDVVFGATVSGRPPGLAGVERTVGMFINTLPVRAQIKPTDTVVEWLQSLQGQQLDSAEHETAALVDVQRWSAVPAGTALFESILVFENLNSGGASEDSTTSTLRIEAPRYVEQSNYPLALLVEPGETLAWELIYDSTRFGNAQIEAIADALQTLLIDITRDPQAKVAELNSINAPTEALLARWSHESADTGAAASTPATESVVETIQRVIEQHPERIAVQSEGAQLSYTDLAMRAGAVRRALATAFEDTAFKGGNTPTGQRIALCLPRSCDMIAAIVGVLQAGCTYVPMDPGWPAERTAFVLQDADADAVLTTGDLAAALPASCRAITLDTLETVTTAEAPRHVDPASTAYIIYTSGSTGTPKGVALSHAALAASNAARSAVYSNDPGHYLLLSPYHFDSSVAGIFWTLSTGGTLVLPATGAERDPVALLQQIEDAQVTSMLCLPSLYEALLDADGGGSRSRCGGLRQVIVAGEACPPAVPARHTAQLPGADLHNEYGPTEACVWATVANLSTQNQSAQQPSRASIGRPVGYTTVYVLDQHGHPLPPGVSGELYLGGPQLADGYVGDPERSAAQFVHRRVPGSSEPVRLYRTGDRVRFRADSSLDFLGRVDAQVKVRGHRIELGEIDARLSAQPGVEDAVVVLRDQQLIAYTVGTATVENLRTALAQSLPEALVPNVFVQLDSMPRTSTGKLDRAALPLPTAASIAQHDGDGFVAPRNPTETTIASIWREVLGLDSVSVDANFYALGGDSLQSIRILARAHRAGLDIDPARFAEDPTIAGAAAAVRGDEEARTQDQVTGFEPGNPMPLTPIQSWFFEQELPDRAHWNMAIALPASQVGPDGASIHSALRALVTRHDALRLRFAGQNEEATQHVAASADCAFAEHDVRNVAIGTLEATKAAKVAELQRSFDLAEGPLFGGLLLHEPSGPTLVLVAHHLVVDAVSWGIIVDELAAQQQQQQQSQTPPHSFSRWVATLRAHATSTTFGEELPYWRTLAAQWSPALPTDRQNDGAHNHVHAAANIVVHLSAAETAQLNEDVPAVYGTKIDDVLLSALARSVQPWIGADAVCLDLESHGRGPHIDGADFASTVGWLTSTCPVRLSCAAQDPPGETLKSIKEQLREATPHGGIGFQLCRTMHPDRALRAEFRRMAPAELLFNNLGRSAVSSTSPELLATLRSDAGQRPHLIEVNVHQDDEGLHARWTYSTQLHDASTIQRLADGFVTALQSIIEHCVSPEAGGATPSDFPMAGLDQGALDALSDLLDD